MTAPLRVATWNIGGGILGASHQRDGVPDLGHHAEVLRARRPDLVLLQEAHELGGEPGQTEVLASLAGYPHWAAHRLSASHLAEGADLALGLLSRFPLRDVDLRPVAAPPLSARGPDGEEWVLHDKGYVVAVAELPGGAVHVVDGHFFPLHHFGRSATEADFAPMWRALADELLRLDDEGPVLAGLDLNHPTVDDVLGDVVTTGRYTEALAPGLATTPRGARRDHLLCGSGARVVGASVVPTLGDHFYCEADVVVHWSRT